VSESGQHWDPARYRREAGFVAELGRPLFQLLQPAPGEKILDLGCGDGRLTAELAATGAEVIGCDLALEQVAAARGLELRVVAATGTRLPFAAGSFDAVLSNAALHWMRDSPAVLAETARVLRPGGRFVGELGGAGNVASIVGVIAAAMAERGLDLAAAFPWTFPTPAGWRRLLQDAGFEVEELQHFARPTPLPADIVGWLHTFAESFLNAVPERERAAFLDEVAAGLEPALRRSDGGWVADYVRLRFAARRSA
jgi:SAM-dependent methyltransferase